MDVKVFSAVLLLSLCNCDGTLTTSPEPLTPDSGQATDAGMTPHVDAGLPVRAPIIDAFTATPASVNPGESARLSWTVSAGATLTLEPAPGAVTGDSLSVSPATTTTYRLLASNSGGTVNATVTVTVVPKPLRLMLFSKTQAFRHDAIPVAVAAMKKLGQDSGWQVEATEDAATVIARLGALDVVAFVMTTGDVFDDAQQSAFEAFIRGGGGYLGIHSAADTEYGWPFYGELLGGAWFLGHPAIQQATVRVDAASQPGTTGVPSPWVRTDEWYNYKANPRPKVQVLLTLTESSYSGGTMGADHPIAWSRTIDSGRAFYTGLGHTNETWTEATFLAHLRQGLLWAGKKAL